jgi:sulfite exporter TauE/SafE/copper chaperone CopZ
MKQQSNIGDLSSQAREKVIFVKGMHCASCEVLIEKKILVQAGVLSADASLGDNAVRVSVQKGAYVNLDTLNSEFKELGYEFSKTPFLTEKVSPKEKRKKFLKTFGLAASFLLIFILIDKLQLGQYVSVDATSSLAAFFFLGVVAGLSSCAALIGGILLSLIKQWNEIYIGEYEGTTKRKKPHLLFHFGRLVSFALLGGVLGLFGSAISFGSAGFYATLTLLVSFVMVVLALQMLDVKWAQRFSVRLPKFISRAATTDLKWGGEYMPFSIGVATFFLPCGFTLVAQGIALTSGSFMSGALIMFVFALGTLPMLLGISLTGLHLTQKPHLTKKFLEVAGVIVLFFALYNINGQMNVLGLPSLNDLSIKSDTSVIACDPTIASCVDERGRQTVSVIAQGFEYLANGSTVFQAGVPTVLEVDSVNTLGCANFIAARGLFRDFVSLKPGKNTIDLGTPKAGTYKLTCSMGMVRPITLTFK